MKKKFKKNIKKLIKKMDLLKDLKISVLSFNFVMTYINHKMLVLIENNLDYFRDSISECFFNQYNSRLLFFLKKNNCFHNI